MYLLFDQALVTVSSGSIIFFKIDEETGLWTEYCKKENMRGQIYFIKGNVRIQIVTDEHIYFYLIDKKTFEPKLENVMYNSMQCSQMMFGSRVRYGITYKANQSNFQIYSRKYYHNFKVTIDTKNYEGALGQNLASMDAYLITDKFNIIINDNKDFNIIK